MLITLWEMRSGMIVTPPGETSTYSNSKDHARLPSVPVSKNSSENFTEADPATLTPVAQRINQQGECR
jgi:hypothetical protein